MIAEPRSTQPPVAVAVPAGDFTRMAILYAFHVAAERHDAAADAGDGLPIPTLRIPAEALYLLAAGDGGEWVVDLTVELAAIGDMLRPGRA